MIDRKATDCHTVGGFYCVKGRTLQRYYKHHLSDFEVWKDKIPKSGSLIYPENISPSLSIDETALSKGELYTIITNKKAKGKKGCLVAIFEGTQSEPIIKELLKIPRHLRVKVKEMTLDMAHSMKRITEVCFTKANQVTDRFHVQKLAIEALQEIRIKYRWKAMDMENEQIQIARKKGVQYVAETFSNGDSRKQLLVRSRYLLFKSHHNWTASQQQRADILFLQYPEIQKAYRITNDLRELYNQRISANIAMTKLAHWYKEVEETGFKSFQSVLNTIKINYKSILAYFVNRSTNASAESFNAKIKAFRAQFRGVNDKQFFLYRLQKIFA